MATIDDKVVSISFENSKFESEVKQTIASLEKLKKSMEFPHAGKGLDDLGRAAGRMNLSRIGQGVEAIHGKLSALSVAGLAIFANLAVAAVSAGARIVKAFALDPIIQGFQEYSTNLNAIQTILANTQASGATLKDVNAALQDLNRYSDKTIYNFSQMAKNIGTFTAAGVDLKTATASIKGIANLAALSGSNADQASTAMYQLSQAIAAGSVKLQDWNSVVNAGMGGTVFQRALAQTAVKMGTLSDGAVKLSGKMKNVSINGEAFRQSLSTPGKASWLTSKVLTKTLQQFTGDLSDAQLAAEGFNKQEIKAIQQTAKTAQQAATQVKTISQVFDVAKETMGSGWANTFQIIFGNFTEARGTFTALSNAINGFINTNAHARNKVLADWKALGGRTVLIKGIKTAFQNLGNIIKPIKDAFHDIFPPATGKSLFKLTQGFAKLAAAIKPSQQTVENLRRTFRGVFAIFDIAGQVIKGVVTMFGHMFKAIGAGKGNFLDFAGSIGDFIVKIDKALKKGNALGKFFGTIGDILGAPIRLVQEFASALGSMFSKFSPGEFSGKIKSMGKSFEPLGRFVDAFARAWDKMITAIKKVDVTPLLDGIIRAFSSMGQALSNAVSNINWDSVFTAVQTGLFAGLVLMFKKFFGKGSFEDALGKAIGGAGGGFLNNFKNMSKSISGSFDALRGSLVAMQNNIRAKTLKEIAIAVGLLAGSLAVISLINPKKLNSAMSAVTITMGELLGAMGIMSSISKSVGFIKLPFVASSLILLAGAMDVLSFAVLAMSTLNWGQLTRGLVGVAGGITILVAAAIPLSKASPGLIRAGIGITGLAIGMDLLVFAVSKLGGMDLKSLGKGLGAVAVGLGTLVLGMKAMPAKGMFAAGAGLIAIGIGLRIIANVVGKFATMNWKQIGKGLTAVGGALAIIAAAVSAMPKGMILQAAGLVAIAFALGMISKTLSKLAGMSWKEIGKGLAALGGALAILALGMGAMQETIGGAAALVVAAFGLKVLTGVLKQFAGMSIGKMIKSLVMLAATLAIIGAAGLVLTPVIPSLLGLGAALILIGAGLTLIGTGIFLIGSGLSAIVLAIATAIGLLVTALKNAVTAFPEFVTGLTSGILEIGAALVKLLPAIIVGIIAMVKGFVTVMAQVLPQVAAVALSVITTVATTLWNNKGTILSAGAGILWSIIKGFVSVIGSLVSTILSMIARLIATIASQLGRMLLSGANLMLSFIRGIASKVGQLVSTGIQAVGRFITAIAGTIGRWVSTGANLLTGFIRGILSKIGALVSAGIQAISRFISSLISAGGRLPGVGSNMMSRFITAIAARAVGLVAVGAAAVAHFVSGVLSALGGAAAAVAGAAFHVGVAIGQGMINGMASMAGSIASKAASMAESAVSSVASHLHLKSPSKVFYDIGQNVVLGFAMGLDDHKQSTDAAIGMSNNLINAVKDVLQIASPSKVFVELGKAVNQGFAQGLLGTSDDIKNAFVYMNQKITEAMKAARETIASEQAKLKKLRDADKPDAKAIAEAQAIIDQNEKLLKRSVAAHILLTKTLSDEKKKLIGLSDDYVKIADKLKAAQQALKDAQQARADAIKSYTDQYSSLPDIVTTDAEGHAVDQLATYEAALKHQADAVAAYQSTLDQLRKLGLDDATYKKLVDEGPADQAFADQLLAGGKTAIDGLNALDKQLKTNADLLAKHAGSDLYDAGVKSAQGLIKSLKDQESKLYKAMRRLARVMVKALKDELGIKSPSQVFFELGTYSMAGFANGISDSKHLLGAAVEEAGNHALSAMQKTMRDISDVVTKEIDVNPTITPILDLTQIRNASGELATLTAVTPITAAASYGQASAISAEQRAALADNPDVAIGGTHLSFVQNNTSPQALSEVEIYRQTKNQLSQAKTALKIS